MAASSSPAFTAAITVAITSGTAAKLATVTAIEHGVWLRPFGKLLYVMPPFICTSDEIDQVTSAVVAVARALT